MTNDTEDFNILSIDVDFCKDERSLRDIIRLFTGIISKQYGSTHKDLPNISFSQTHSDILSCISGRSLVNIYNIDDHHDIYYEPEDMVGFEDGVVCESNWVGWTMRSGLLNEYHWIKNRSSELLPQQDLLSLQSQSLSYGKFNSNVLKDGRVEQERSIYFYNTISDAKLKEKSFAEVFVCMSPEYLSKDFHYLYFLLIDLAEDFLGRDSFKVF